MALTVAMSYLAFYLANAPGKLALPEMTKDKSLQRPEIRHFALLYEGTMPCDKVVLCDK